MGPYPALTVLIIILIGWFNYFTFYAGPKNKPEDSAETALLKLQERWRNRWYGLAFGFTGVLVTLAGKYFVILTELKGIH